jgi:hypothetical protein
MSGEATSETASSGGPVRETKSPAPSRALAHRIIATHIFIKSVGVQHMRMTKAMRQTLNRHEKLVQSSKLPSYFYETASIKFHQAVVKWLYDLMSVALISDSLGHDNRPIFSNCL